MVPPASDLRWRGFLDSLGTVQSGNLATRMLINRLKLKLTFDSSDASKLEAIRAAHDFFARYESAVLDDIKHIFG